MLLSSLWWVVNCYLQNTLDLRQASKTNHKLFLRWYRRLYPEKIYFIWYHSYMKTISLSFFHWILKTWSHGIKISLIVWRIYVIFWTFFEAALLKNVWWTALSIVQVILHALLTWMGKRRDKWKGLFLRYWRYVCQTKLT